MFEQILHKEKPLSKWQIKNVHRLVLKGIDDAYAGVYRDQQVFSAGATHVPPAPYLIQEQIDQMKRWYQSETKSLHPIERGAMLHAIFVGIIHSLIEMVVHQAYY